MPMFVRLPIVDAISATCLSLDAGPPPEVFETSALAALRTLLGLGSRMARAPAFEAAEGSGTTTGGGAVCSWPCTVYTTLDIILIAQLSC